MSCKDFNESLSVKSAKYHLISAIKFYLLNFDLCFKGRRCVSLDYVP